MTKLRRSVGWEVLEARPSPIPVAQLVFAHRLASNQLRQAQVRRRLWEGLQAYPAYQACGRELQDSKWVWSSGVRGEHQRCPAAKLALLQARMEKSKQKKWRGLSRPAQSPNQ